MCVSTYLVCYIVFTFTTINASEALFTSLHTHSHSHASIHLKQVNDKWVSIKENDSNFSSLFEFAGCQLSLIGIWHGLGAAMEIIDRQISACTHQSEESHTHKKACDWKEIRNKKVISTSSCCSVRSKCVIVGIYCVFSRLLLFRLDL